MISSVFKNRMNSERRVTRSDVPLSSLMQSIPPVHFSFLVIALKRKVFPETTRRDDMKTKEDAIMLHTGNTQAQNHQTHFHVKNAPNP